MESLQLSVQIARPSTDVYEYSRQRSNLSEWATGVTDDLSIEFAALNPHGVIDHWVTIEGIVFYNPMRVIPIDETSCEVVFSLRRLAGVTDEEFETDRATIERDLESLRLVLENSKGTVS